MAAPSKFNPESSVDLMRRITDKRNPTTVAALAALYGCGAQCIRNKIKEYRDTVEGTEDAQKLGFGEVTVLDGRKAAKCGGVKLASVLTALKSETVG